MRHAGALKLYARLVMDFENQVTSESKQLVFKSRCVQRGMDSSNIWICTSSFLSPRCAVHGSGGLRKSEEQMLDPSPAAWLENLGGVFIPFLCIMPAHVLGSRYPMFRAQSRSGKSIVLAERHYICEVTNKEHKT